MDKYIGVRWCEANDPARRESPTWSERKLIKITHSLHIFKLILIYQHTTWLYWRTKLGNLSYLKITYLPSPYTARCLEILRPCCNHFWLHYWWRLMLVYFVQSHTHSPYIEAHYDAFRKSRRIFYNLFCKIKGKKNVRKCFDFCLKNYSKITFNLWRYKNLSSPIHPSH